MRISLFHGVLLCAAVNGSPLRKRDILSDIGNFFDNLEMQVDMTIFQPIVNFFTEAGAEFNQYVVIPAEGFFMQAQAIVVAAEYNIDMLTADLAHAIEQDVIDEVNSVENLATSVAQQIKNDVNTVTNDIGNEFNNVIGPGIANVGQQIGSAFTTLGNDLVPAFEEAGAYIEAHPELIAEILLTAALIGVTAVQPELAGADGALIADIAVEVGAETGAEVAVDIGSGAAEGIADTAAESFLEAADEPIYANIPSFWSSSEPIYANIQEFLDQASGTVAENVGDLEPIEQSTVDNLQTEAEAFNNAAKSGSDTLTNLNGGSGLNQPIPIPYPNINNVITALQNAGKIILVKRSNPPPTTITTKSSHPPTSSTTTKASHPPTSTATKAKTPSSSSKATATTATTAHSSTAPIPSPSLKAVLAHHYLRRTNSSKTFASRLFSKSLFSSLSNNTIVAKSALLPHIPTALNSPNTTASIKNIPYPPSQQAHQNAIAHQIATGKATAYNKGNATLKIQMDANAPKDPCLGLAKVNCQFGNQIGQPYCREGCAGRWYNKMNIVPEHF